MTVTCETVLPLYRETVDTATEAEKKQPRLTLEFANGTSETISLLPPSILLRPWITVLAHWVTTRHPTGLLLEHCLMDAAWLNFWKIIRATTCSTTTTTKLTKLTKLSLESCRFQSSQAALQALLQISHWKHLQYLRWHVVDSLEGRRPNHHNAMVTTPMMVWERVMARTASTLQYLDIAGVRLVGVGRGWTAAHVEGRVTGSLPLEQLRLKGCGLGRQELADMVEGLSRQQPCRIQVLHLARNDLHPDCLPSISKLLELSKGSLRDLNISENPRLFPRESSSQVDSLEWALSQCLSLQHLSLANCGLSGRFAVQLVSPCRQLHSLNLSKNPIGPVVWPTLMKTILPSIKELRILNLSGTLIEPSKEYVLAFFGDNTSLEEVFLPSDADPLIKKRVDAYTKRNQRLRCVHNLMTSHEENPAVWGAAYKCLIPDEGDDLSAFHLLVSQGVTRHGYASSLESTISSGAIPPSPPLPSTREDDNVSEITAEEWSQINAAVQDPMSMDEYSIIEAGVL